MNIACAVTDDGRRVIGREAMLKAIGRTGKIAATEASASDPRDFTLPVFLAADSLKPYVSQQNLHAPTSPICYRTLAGQKAQTQPKHKMLKAVLNCRSFWRQTT